MKEQILIRTERILSELIGILSLFDQEQINTRPFDGSWTAAQVGEHLLKSYSVTEVLNGPAIKSERPPDQKIAEVEHLFLNFDIKMSSPEFILPSDGPFDKQILINSLEARKEEICRIIQTSDLTEICTGFSIPEYGEFTRLEWINFIIVHTLRHIQQLKHIKKIVLIK